MRGFVFDVATGKLNEVAPGRGRRCLTRSGGVPAEEPGGDNVTTGAKPSRIPIGTNTAAGHRPGP